MQLIILLFQDAFFIWEQIKNLEHKNESQLITICMKIDSIPDLEFATQFVIQHSWFYPVKCRFFSVLIPKSRNLFFFGTYNIDFSNILLNPKNFMFASQRVS